MHKTAYYVLIISVFIASCSGSKKIAATGEKPVRMSNSAIIKAYNAHKNNFTSLKTAVKIKLITPEKTENFTASLRVLKDQKIWISIGKSGITGGKILITPTKILYYNKFEKNYLESDFNILSTWLGASLTFKQLQAILLSESLFTLHKKTHKAKATANGYSLYKKKGLHHEITLQPTHFNVMAQHHITAQNQSLKINYIDAHDIKGQILPKQIILQLLTNDSAKKIELKYNNIKLNETLRFPFKIPSSYSKIHVEK